MLIGPATSRAYAGDDVPMPTYPLDNTVIRVVVPVPSAEVEAMVNSGVRAGVVQLFEIERKEYGDVVPIPTLPIEPMKSVDVAWAVLALLPTRVHPAVRVVEIPVPPVGVVVAITCPLGLTARNVPAATPSPEIVSAPGVPPAADAPIIILPPTENGIVGVVVPTPTAPANVDVAELEVATNLRASTRPVKCPRPLTSKL